MFILYLNSELVYSWLESTQDNPALLRVHLQGRLCSLASRQAGRGFSLGKGVWPGEAGETWPLSSISVTLGLCTLRSWRGWPGKNNCPSYPEGLPKAFEENRAGELTHCRNRIDWTLRTGLPEYSCRIPSWGHGTCSQLRGLGASALGLPLSTVGCFSRVRAAAPSSALRWH